MYLLYQYIILTKGRSAVAALCSFVVNLISANQVMIRTVWNGPIVYLTLNSMLSWGDRNCSPDLFLAKLVCLGMGTILWLFIIKQQFPPNLFTFTYTGMDSTMH